MRDQEHKPPGARRPWWASDLTWEDHPAGRPADSGRDSDGVGRDHPEEGSPPGEHRHDPGEICQACPVCALLHAVDRARPEVIDHLLAASQHLRRAVRAAADPPAGGVGDRLEHIPLDED